MPPALVPPFPQLAGPDPLRPACRAGAFMADMTGLKMLCFMISLGLWSCRSTGHDSAGKGRLPGGIPPTPRMGCGAFTSYLRQILPKVTSYWGQTGEVAYGSVPTLAEVRCCIQFQSAWSAADICDSGFCTHL